MADTGNGNTKVVILAGGRGTRLAEETETRPKAMVEIGGMPIVLHIMKQYAQFGFREFVLALGYKGDLLKRFFLDYPRLRGSLSVDLGTGATEAHDGPMDEWQVHLMDTGLDTETGGRLRRLQPTLEGGTFMVTYCDGVSDVDLNELLRFHRGHGQLATVTAVRPPARFGGLVFDGDRVAEFTEKPQAGEGWINGGFLVFEPGVFGYLQGDQTILERDALPRLARDGELMAFRHDRFWQCMDTMRDVRLLQELWTRGDPPWGVWR